MRILIVDDHAVVRRGLIEIIRETIDRNVEFSEADTGIEALRLFSKADYDLVLMDISLPGRNGLEIMKAMQLEKPSTPILVISMYPEEQFAIRSLKAGATGYLTKETAPDELKTAISKILKGGKYVSQKLSELMLSDIAGKIPLDGQLHTVLSDREFSVFCMLASGAGIKEISQKLGLSDKTISTYRSRILSKMGMKNNADIIAYAINCKLVQ